MRLVAASIVRPSAEQRKAAMNILKKENAHFHHDFRYLFFCEQEFSVPTKPDEILDYQWIDIRELQRSVTSTKIAPKILHVISREFRQKRFYDRIVKNLSIWRLLFQKISSNTTSI